MQTETSVSSLALSACTQRVLDQTRKNTRITQRPTCSEWALMLMRGQPSPVKQYIAQGQRLNEVGMCPDGGGPLRPALAALGGNARGRRRAAAAGPRSPRQAWAGPAVGCCCRPSPTSAERRAAAAGPRCPHRRGRDRRRAAAAGPRRPRREWAGPTADGPWRPRLAGRDRTLKVNFDQSLDLFLCFFICRQ